MALITSGKRVLITEAGIDWLKTWPKLLQNLRTTRATELAAEYPSHVAARVTQPFDDGGAEELLASY
ncbi:hypothetical protein [Lacipirellula parvula]|uniref:Uncharacterized protein n=1 Tax=Lacipirellula parvula TaxID=2650471 RepID=A0A5K7XIT4_9BACT|nr:hypothetical protein [Lacipirellula parvula]BBO32809.1 hypothetical protein PLANPX_2421 [Lacipirellula parvula]